MLSKAKSPRILALLSLEPALTMLSEGETAVTEADLKLICPQFSEEDNRLIAASSYWCEGIILCIFAVLGIVGNSVSSVILGAKNMRNSFNLLLIALAVYDNTYLAGAILESFRKRFKLVSDLHIYLFPYFLYPLHMVAMTGSILMTVAIALERFVAVHYPINYSQAMNDSRALKRRVLQYLIPVGVLSLAMNVTKFFEIDLAYINVAEENATAIYIPTLNITEFRMNPTYSITFNWFRFISIGIVPFCLLVFFNTHIYLDIRKRRVPKKRGVSQSEKSMAVQYTAARSEPNVNGETQSPSEAAKLVSPDDKSHVTTMVVTTAEQHNKGKKSSPITTVTSVASANDARRRMENNLAIIMFGYVLVFLVCHLPRLILNIYELAIIRNAMECSKHNLDSFPLWSLIVMHISHLLLVVNSSINCIIYCCLSSKFREEGYAMLARCCSCCKRGS